MKKLSDKQASWIVLIVLLFYVFLDWFQSAHFVNFAVFWAVFGTGLLLIHPAKPNVGLRLIASVAFGAICIHLLQGHSTTGLEVPVIVILLSIASVIVCKNSPTIKKQEPFIWMLLLTVATGFLARAGSSQFGAGGMIDWFSHFGISPETAEILTICVRKFVHLAYFGFLAILAFSSFDNTTSPRYRAGWAVAWVLMNASFDEFHQSFAANRTGTPFDVTVDLLGAIFGLWLIAKIHKRNTSESQQSIPA